MGVLPEIAFISFFGRGGRGKGHSTIWQRGHYSAARKGVLLGGAPLIAIEGEKTIEHNSSRF